MKIVQVPMEEVEAQALMSQAKRMHMSRADLIRRACAEYMAKLETLEQEREYARGYEEIPDDGMVAQSGCNLLPSVLAPEDWEF